MSDSYHFNKRERKEYPYLVETPASWRSKDIIEAAKEITSDFKISSNSTEWMFGKGKFGVRFTHKADADKFSKIVENGR